jgi:hypothetical protein
MGKLNCNHVGFRITIQEEDADGVPQNYDVCEKCGEDLG